jgi:MFS family permease
MTELSRLFILRPFRRLIFAYCICALGTWLAEIALAVLVLRETGSPAAVATVFVAGLCLPALLVPPLVTRIECLPASRSLPALLLIEAGLFAVLAALTPSFSLVLVASLVALDGVAGLAARALIKASLVATTNPAGLLREGNTVLVVVFTACAAVGPFAAGACVAVVSPQGALAVDAVFLSLAGLTLARGTNFVNGSANEQGFLERFRAGIAHVRERVALRRLLSGYAVLSLFAAAVLPVEVVLVTETLGSSEADYGLVLGLWGLGAVVGSALLPLLRRAPLSLLIAGSFIVFAVSYAGMGIAQSLVVVCLFSLLGGTANGIDAFAVMTAVQEQTADECQARVNGFFEALMAGSTGLGFVAGGVIATAASPRAVFLLAGLGILLATAATAAPRRPLRKAAVDAHLA